MSEISTSRVRKFLSALRSSPDDRTDRRLIREFEAELDTLEGSVPLANRPLVENLIPGQTTIDDFV